MAIKFHKSAALPSSPTPADDGVYFVKANGNAPFRAYIIDNGEVFKLNGDPIEDQLTRIYGDRYAGGPLVARDLVNPFLINQPGIHNHKVIAIGTSKQSILEFGSNVDIPAKHFVATSIRPDSIWEGKIFLQWSKTQTGAGATIYFDCTQKAGLGIPISYQLPLTDIGNTASCDVIINFQVIFHGGGNTKWYTVIGEAIYKYSNGYVRMDTVEVKATDPTIDTSEGVLFNIYFKGNQSNDKVIARNITMRRMEQPIIS
jgi:hypothetical protein